MPQVQQQSNTTQRLSFRLARLGVVLAVLVSLVSSSYQVFLDFREEKNTLNTLLERMLDGSTFAASRAVHTLDFNLANEVVNGLFVYDYVIEASITDELGNTLARRETDAGNRPTPWYTQFLQNRYVDYQSPLLTDSLGEDIFGLLTLTVDQAVAYESFIDRAQSTLLLGAAKNFVLIVLFLLVFYRLITKPLNQLSNAVDAIDPEAPQGERLPMPVGHEKDELGALATNINLYLSNTEQLLLDNARAHRDADESYRNLRRLVDSLPHLIFVNDEQGQLLLVNQLARTSFHTEGLLSNNETQAILLKHFDDRSRELILDAQQSVLSHHNSLFIPELEWLDEAGNFSAIEARLLPLEFRGEQAVLFVGVDITERKKHQARMQHMAYHDPLTDLPNRHLFLDRLSQSLKRSGRTGMSGALIFIDLDNFKNINDSLGHSAGDTVLRQISARIQDIVRSEDTVARLGGDEFVVCINELGRDDDTVIRLAEQRAENLRVALHEPFFVNGQRLRVTASLGIALFPDREQTASDLLRNADTAMYQAKSQGKDTHIVFEPAMAEATAFRISLENDLRQALEREEFFLTFQPQFENECIIGAEALLRWQHPTRGVVSPVEFIPVLESMGLIVSVGDWTLRHACLCVQRWRSAGLWQDHMVLGINVSPQQFSQPEFFDEVRRAITEAQIPAACINLEITEGMVIHEVEETIIRMKQIREFGVSFSIDDFGTGYSSLSYLKRLPLDVLKVDQSFVRDIHVDTNDAAIVETILSMARHLKLDTIAEGVETLDQVRFLEEKGCQRYQGYYFSPPLLEADLEALLHRQTTLLETP
ncbi:MAG: putative bifunctional diguanylate cyclase/phosphodiesterase [Saccharospirillum sp.]